MDIRKNWKEIESTILDLIYKRSFEISQIKLDSHLEKDLHFDELDRMEFLMEAEVVFDESFDIDSFEQFNTVEDIFVYFVRTFPRKVFSDIDIKILRFSLKPDGSLRVLLQKEDGSWTFADGKTVLPSSLCVLTYSRWTSVLKELELLINDPSVKENDLQKFFEEYPELIAADDFDTVISQAAIQPTELAKPWRADFVLTPIDQNEFSEILELKLPQMKLTNKPKSGHITFSAKLYYAIQQLKDYANAFNKDDARNRFFDKYKLDIFEPDLHLIAGREWDIAWTNSIRKMKEDTYVKIENWDELLLRLKKEFV